MVLQSGAILTNDIILYINNIWMCMAVNYSHDDVRSPGDQAGKMGHIHIIHENEA